MQHVEEGVSGLARRALSFLMAGSALALLAVGVGGACGGETVPGEECVGGIIINGTCEGKCTPDKCIEANTCVGNRCVLTCDSHRDCFQDGSQVCAPSVEDDTGASIFTCQTNQKAPGFGAECPFGDCEAFLACPDGGRCDPAQCGGAPDQCERDETACGDDASCKLGKCAESGDACVVQCPVAECAALTCLGVGEGDADAYCSKHDRESDVDCGAGFECGITRDKHELCGSANPKKGNNNFCGQTSEPCVDSATFGQGNTYFEGSICILRKTCIKREPCSPCETDLDCSLNDALVCTDIGGSKRCAATCGSDTDCLSDHSCQGGACIPRFGSCEGDGNFCEPCRFDPDCGGPDTTSVCLTLSDGQRGCVDLSFPETCETDADCPLTPAGKHGACIDDPSSTLHQRCHLPPPSKAGKWTCWCATADECPQGNECQTATCEAGGCGLEPVDAGKPVKNVPGNCHAEVACDGAGGITTAVDDTDLPPSDGNPCTVATCTGGVPSHEPVAAGDGCDDGAGGAVCDGAGACVQCFETAHCEEGFVCEANLCQPE